MRDGIGLLKQGDLANGEEKQVPASCWNLFLRYAARLAATLA